MESLATGEPKVNYRELEPRVLSRLQQIEGAGNEQRPLRTGARFVLEAGKRLSKLWQAFFRVQHVQKANLSLVGANVQNQQAAEPLESIQFDAGQETRHTDSSCQGGQATLQAEVKSASKDRNKKPMTRRFPFSQGLPTHLGDP